VQKEALLQALRQDPTLVETYPELQELKRKEDALMLKLKGNEAFVAGAYEKAVETFSICIEKDPTNEIYYGNRAAAYMKMERWKDAMADSRRAIMMNPGYVKGYVRLGAALLHLEDPEAVEVLQKARELEPDLRDVDPLLAKANGMVQEQKRRGIHKFHKKDKPVPQAHRSQTDVHPIKIRKTTALSFEEEEE